MNTKLFKIPNSFRKRLTLREWLRYKKIDQLQTSAEIDVQKKGINFRQLEPDLVRENYNLLSAQEFEQINSRQQWVNWILIGKCLHKQVPDKALNVLDIGCGTGTSTSVLAYYLPIGSKIIANDLADSLVEVAKKRKYISAYDGQDVKTQFVAQDATKPFVNGQGEPVENGSLDYINTSGIVGHHFSKSNFKKMIEHLREPAKKGCIAAIDEGPELGEKPIVEIMNQMEWDFIRPVRILPWNKRGQLLFRFNPKGLA